jgi:hypothetical protein
MTDIARESIENLTQIVRELTARLEIQEAELQHLRSSRPSRCDRPGQTKGMSQGGGISRSRLLRIAGVGAVAAAAAGVEMGARANTAFAKSGDAVTAGAVTNSESATMVNYDGSAGFENAVILGNDSTYTTHAALAFPAGVAGLAGAGSTAGPGGLSNGVLGFTDNGAGNGVIGVNTNLVDGDGAGVFGKNDGTNADGSGVKGTHAGGGSGGLFTSNTGIGVVASGSTGLQASGFTQAVYATSHNPSDFASVIEGELTASTSGDAAAGVYGKNDGTNGNGCGVRGSHAGGGSGGLFNSNTGIGVVATGSTGVQASGFTQGVYGTSHNPSDNASAIQGELTASASGVDGAGVYGKNDATNANGCGVKGTHAGGGSGGLFTSTAGDGVSGKSAGAGAGIRGVSTGGRGAILSGHSAQLQLVPSQRSSHPTSGQAGDIFLDAHHRLWLCLGKKNWKQMA